MLSRFTRISELSATFLALVVSAALAAVDPLEKVVDNPPATGLLLLMVVQGGAGAAGGLAVGDVLTHYGGDPVPDQPALQKAMQAHAEDEKVEVRYVREEKELRVTLKPGRLGVGIRPVEKGKPLPRHPDTPYEPALQNIQPGESFFTIAVGAAKAGFERQKVEVEGNLVKIDRLVRFKFKDGEQDARMRLTLQRDRYLTVQKLHFSSPDGVMGDLKREGSALVGKVHGKDFRLEVPPNTVPSWAVDFVTLAMPRQSGACLRITILSEDDFTLARHFEIYCAEEHSVKVNGKPVKAFRYDENQFGGITTHRWITADHQLLKLDYGGPVADRTSREVALNDLPAGVRTDY